MSASAFPANEADWVWFGEQGHFMGLCEYHLHTHVGNRCISTVGDYMPKSESDYETLSLLVPDAYYETMVFSIDPETGEWNESAESIYTRHYTTREEADKGHTETCRQFAYRAPDSEAI